MAQLPVLIIGAGDKTGPRITTQLVARGIVTGTVSRSSARRA